MKVLLDTHSFLWGITEPGKAESFPFPASAEFLEAHMGQLGIRRVLPISPVHVYAVLQLPPAHKDPFDRLLAAQCRVENLPIISADALLRGYPIEVVW